PCGAGLRGGVRSSGGTQGSRIVVSIVAGGDRGVAAGAGAAAPNTTTASTAPASASPRREHRRAEAPSLIETPSAAIRSHGAAVAPWKNCARSALASARDPSSRYVM